MKKHDLSTYWYYCAWQFYSAQQDLPLNKYIKLQMIVLISRYWKVSIKQQRCSVWGLSVWVFSWFLHLESPDLLISPFLARRVKNLHLTQEFKFTHNVFISLISSKQNWALNCNIHWYYYLVKATSVWSAALYSGLIRQCIYVFRGRYCLTCKNCLQNSKWLHFSSLLIPHGLFVFK